MSLPPSLEKRAKALIMGHVGRRHMAELDAGVAPRIGIGFNLQRADAPSRLAAVGAPDFVAIARGRVPISDQQIDRLFDDDFGAAVAAARSVVPGFDTLIPEWRIVLIDLAFDVGRVRLSTFRRMIAAICAGQHERAIDELRTLRWASDNPSRMNQDAALVLSALPSPPWIDDLV